MITMRPASRLAFRITAALGFLAVMLGALGAHGPLYEALRRRNATGFWEKAVFYQFVHAVVMLTICGLRPFPSVAWSLFGAGIVAFSGSLYLLSFVTLGWLGLLTPLGGLCLLAGWVVLGVWGTTQTSDQNEIVQK